MGCIFHIKMHAIWRIEGIRAICAFNAQTIRLGCANGESHIISYIHQKSILIESAVLGNDQSCHKSKDGYRDDELDDCKTFHTLIHIHHYNLKPGKYDTMISFNK